MPPRRHSSDRGEPGAGRRSGGAAEAAAITAALANLGRAPDLALFVVDADLLIRLAIGGLLTARGWPGSDLVGRRVDEFVSVDGAGELLAHYRAGIAGVARHFEHRDPAGRCYVVDVVPTVSGPHDHATILWREVTTLRLAEAEHEMTEQRYRLLAENASDVVSLHGPDRRILWISPSVRTILGHDPDDLVGSDARDLVHPDDLETIRKRDAEVGDRTADQLSTARVRHVDGTYRWMETSVVSVPVAQDPELSTFVLAGRDVTDRMLAEQALRHSEARARTLLDTMADAAVLYDADGDVIARSQSSRELMGADDGVLRLDTDDSVAGWVDPQGAPLIPALHPAMLARLASGTVTTVVSLRRPDGAHRWVRATASAVDASKPSGSIVLTLFDITDLHDARVDLERSNEELRRMALVASHDLGAPLAMLRRELAAVAAIAAGELDGSAATRLRQAGDAVDMMQETLGAVLAYAQVDGAAVESEVVDLDTVAAETLAILCAQIEESGAVVDVGELPAVVGDRVLVRQLLLSLTGNAITHHPGPAPHITVRSECRGETPLLIVEDDGDGIPADARERVFGLFARDRSPTAGHGIGLATAKRIVELHGGRIWIEQAEPRGARICVTLAASAMPLEPS